MLRESLRNSPFCFYVAKIFVGRVINDVKEFLYTVEIDSLKASPDEMRLYLGGPEVLLTGPLFLEDIGFSDFYIWIVLISSEV